MAWSWARQQPPRLVTSVRNTAGGIPCTMHMSNLLVEGDTRAPAACILSRALSLLQQGPVRADRVGRQQGKRRPGQASVTRPTLWFCFLSLLGAWDRLTVGRVHQGKSPTIWLQIGRLAQAMWRPSGHSCSLMSSHFGTQRLKNFLEPVTSHLHQGTWKGAIATGWGEAGGTTHAGGGRVPTAGSQQLATLPSLMQLILAEEAIRP
ncbi:hypothetical protein E2C01_055222 [Portunus trituberculatus]|uniref:Uncharacterized protein n=1 Tax=Portunus trituberculatus TaxID=210409 RepID=A0A5B7GU91_PORTR|nr:hypothetical protein [Portunus trituberculatus]